MKTMLAILWSFVLFAEGVCVFGAIQLFLHPTSIGAFRFLAASGFLIASAESINRWKADEGK